MSAVERVGVVTGAGRGLGRALALRLADAGYSVTGLDRNVAGLDETGELCRAKGVGFTSVEVDLLDEAARTEVFAALPAADLAIANAGILEISNALDLTTDSLVRMLTVNTISTYEFMQASARAMTAASRRGRILVIASDAAVRGIPQLTGYVGSKHAIAGLARSLELELEAAGSQVRVTIAFPGAIATGLAGTDPSQWGGMAPAEVAETVLAPLLSASPTVLLRELHLAPAPRIPG